ncbi:MAG: hypothetical protein ACK5QH_09695 [Rubrivivax sp.]|jgi:hypothetical protein
MHRTNALAAPMPPAPNRRSWLLACAGGLLPLHHRLAYTETHPMLDDTMIDAETPRFDPVPALPTTPTPGRAGDFGFLDGRWHIRHLKRRGAQWDRFDGEARCWSILGGVGHVEELLIPARDFSGLGLRMLDVQAQRWSDHWVNAKQGVVTAPGQTGSFENGAGLFGSTYEDQGRTFQSLGIWDRIGDGVCRWRQVVSGDGGQTWEHDWVMHWRRVG